MKKKLLCLLLAICMVLLVVPTLAIAADEETPADDANPEQVTDENTNGEEEAATDDEEEAAADEDEDVTPISEDVAFTDIADHWAKDAITTWSDYGVLLGSDGKFRPNDSISRAEMAAVLNRIAGYVATSSTSFTDVPSDAWYAGDVSRLNAAGVMLGSDGAMRPLDKITREEAAVMIARVFAVAGGSGSAFADADAISSWAADAVAAMKAAGYISGANNQFRPKDNITRAEVVTIIDNMIDAFYTEAGDYADAVDGNVVIKAAGVNLTNAVIGGDVYFMPGVADDGIVLDKTQVSGTVYLFGGAALEVAADTTIKNLNVATKAELKGVGTIEKLYVSVDGVVIATTVVLDKANISVADGVQVTIGEELYPEAAADDDETADDEENTDETTDEENTTDEDADKEAADKETDK